MRKPQSDGVRSRERLMPALLDRLTDTQPTQRSEADMPGQGSAALRTAVLRDLGWLLNATSLAAGVDLSRFHEARRSVLNYGVLPLAGKRVSELDCQELANGIRLAILHYEPRLLPDSVEVACVSHLDTLALRNELAFEIRARLWAQPYPLAFMVRSELDLESGHTVLRDLVEG
ncbi:type VI secretion system baseplate subunit TssE [Chitinolyticbacter meiyuanensis]|uniref:type VI secretion system baseplate subunit TssE n=1 Tax=Chitinolyticbacter meiyuanensis TaxID=682798 RepID=UPI0011E5D0A7|nr:type VI secretion system baseplate subunit TssE [Chitinolyticbacter meiyuanensis]